MDQDSGSPCSAPRMVSVRPTSSFLRTVRAALWADAQREIELALKAALLLEHDVPRGEIAERLGVTAEEARAAIKRAQWARAELERDASP
jgi:hypothetical protein